MTEKKFHIPSIIIASAAVILELFSLIAEGLIVAIVALIISAKKKETHRTKIGVVLSILAIIFAIGGFAFFMFVIARLGTESVETGYWLINLFLK